MATRIQIANIIEYAKEYNSVAISVVYINIESCN